MFNVDILLIQMLIYYKGKTATRKKPSATPLDTTVGPEGGFPCTSTV